jgi:tetratricopeptide (TPR) repeat protein/CHAT domain-containing protein
MPRQSPDIAAQVAVNEQVACLVGQGRFREALAALPLDEMAPADLLPVDRARRLELEGVVRRELGQYAQAESPLLQALSLGASTLGKEHADYARTLHELGRLYEELGQYAGAERLFRSAMSIREQTLGTHADLAESLHDLGGLCDLTARHVEAEAFYLRSRQMRFDLLGGDDPAYAQSLVTQAWISWRHGRLRAGESLAHRAVDILRKSRGADHPEFATGEQLLSRFHLHQARLDEAERLALHVRKVRGEALGEHHHRYAGALENLALIRAVQGRPDEAQRLANQGIAITRAALGERHPHVADGLAALAYTYQTQRRHADAEKQYLEALEIYRASLGDKHPHVAGCLRDLGEVCAAQERYAEAEDHYRKAVALLRPHGPACALELIETLQGLARVVAAQNRPDEADRLGLQAVDQARKLAATPADVEGDDGSALLASSLDGLARIYQVQGRLAEAEPLIREVIACRARALGEGHPLHSEAMRNLAALFASQGKYAEAMTLEEGALASLRKSLGDAHPETIQALSGLAELHWQKGDTAKAEELFTQVADAERVRVGEDHVDHARAVQQLARLYLAMNNISAAEVRYRQVIDIFEKAHGDEHPEYAAALHDLAGLHQQTGDLGTAEHLYQRAREIRQQHLGDAHPDHAQSLHGLASVYQAMNRFDEAGPLFRQALQIMRTHHGEDNPATLRMLHSLALFEQAGGNYQPAREHLEYARDRLTSQVGERSPMLVPILSDLARLHGGVGDHVAAEPLWRQVQAIHLTAFPEDHLQHAQDQSNLANTLRALSEPVEAERLQRESLKLVEKERGLDHPDTAIGLHILAGMVQARAGADEAALDEAEDLYDRSLARTRSSLGQGHPAVASVLSEIAGLQASRGKTAEALETYRQAGDIIRRSLGEDHAENINLLRQMAGLHQARGDLGEAEKLLQQRLTIIRRLFGPNSPILVPGQQQIADIYRSQGRLDEAEALCRQAVQTLERERDAARERDEDDADDDEEVEEGEADEEGDEEDSAAMGLALAENNLASIHLARGRLDLAEPLLRRSLAGVLASVGEDHPAYAGAVFNLAALCAATGRGAEARTLLERLADVDNRQVPQLLALVPERFRAFSTQGMHENFETCLSLVAPQLIADPAGAWRTLDLVLRRKRLGMDILAEPPLAAWQAKYPVHADDLRRLWLLDRQIANKRFAGPGPEGLETHRELLANWLEDREQLEKGLGDHIPELARRRLVLRVETEAVRAAIAPGWALVEFVHYRSTNFATIYPPPGAEPPDRPGRFLAFVLKSGDTNPAVFDLGPSKVIDENVAGWRQWLETAGTSGDANAGAALYAALVAPLASVIADCRGLIFAPDGELLHLPIDALPTPDGRHLLNRYEVLHVLSGRDLLRGRVETTLTAPFVLGAGRAAPSSMKPGIRGWLSRLLGREKPTIGWRFLGGIRAEVAAVSAQLGVKPTPVSAPAREVMFGLHSPRGIHLAAPTEFLLDPFDLYHKMAADPSFVPPWQNPLTLCGLGLSGDEAMHARDITRLDLWQVPQVFLAACATPSMLQGAWWRVSGLVGALLQAGARNVVMSLWPVPEPIRTEMVERFYRSITEGKSPAESLRRARLEMGRRHPYPGAWAGWICVGGGE